jgi:hypothetical protein
MLWVMVVKFSVNLSSMLELPKGERFNLEEPGGYLQWDDLDFQDADRIYPSSVTDLDPTRGGRGDTRFIQESRLVCSYYRPALQSTEDKSY